MKPGRELDALVAIEVMGWCGCGCVGEDSPDLPRYSEDIAAAWEVVGEMKRKLLEDWPSFQILGVVDSHSGDMDYYCTFGLIGSAVISDTAPHAICLAALKAVGAT